MADTDDVKVFVLGDSRTGTTSIHKFLLDAGFRSVHFFEPEVAQIAQSHGREDSEYADFKEFVQRGDFNAFSDYPTPVFYKEIYDDYADAYFILSFRKNIRTWIKSMQAYFRGAPDKIADLYRLCERYAHTNREIRGLYQGSRRFLEICIDDGSRVNAEKMNAFLPLDEQIIFRHLNASQNGARYTQG